ncbi:MAG TPA: hypothetical protein VEH81_12600, partial [Ktedonobacteraceae bacterium]|nr:hypothetical protein [Ktedonobacteraceae bacterium]
QPPRPPGTKRERWFIVSALLIVLVLLLALGSFFIVQLTNQPATHPAPTPKVTTTPKPGVTTTPAPVTTPTPAPSITTSPKPPVASYQPLNAIWMINATTGWARTTTQRILRTSDGGTSWQDVTPPYPAGSTVQVPAPVSILNGKVAWVAVFEKQQPDGTVPNVVFRTSNGGTTWQEAMLPTSILGVSQVQFVNAQDGWILASFGGEGAGSQMVNVFRSTDGGQTWSLVARAGSSSNSISLAGKKTGMGWISPTTGWITGTIAASQNTVWLYKTLDGGVSWQPQSLMLPAIQGIIITQPPVFFSATDGLLPVTFYNSQGTSLDVYTTHDGGASWSSSTLLSNVGSSWNFLSMQQGWVIGANGSTLYETSDGGQHWTSITTSVNFQNISQLNFVSAQQGWAISTITPTTPVLLKTVDGGQTWVQISPGPKAAAWTVVASPNAGTSFNYLNGVAAVSANDIWAVGYSSNGTGPFQALIEHWNGTGWQVVSSPSPGTFDNSLVGVNALSAGNIWAVGYDDMSGKASQTLIEHWNGANWQMIASPDVGSGSSTLSGVVALSDTNIWAVGSYYTTTNEPLIEHWNGTNWQVVTSPTIGGFLTHIAAVNATDIWAVGYASNGSTPFQTLIEHWNGTNWQVVSSPSAGTGNNYLTGIAALSATNAWAVGYYQHANGISTLIEHWNGTNWQVVSSPNVETYSYLFGVAAESPSNVWAVGYTANSVSNRPSQTLIELWNGMNWQVVASPNKGTSLNSLSGVAASSPDNTWAVGQYQSNLSSPIQTLIERWNEVVTKVATSSHPGNWWLLS